MSRKQSPEAQPEKRCPIEPDVTERIIERSYTWNHEWEGNQRMEGTFKEGTERAHLGFLAAYQYSGLVSVTEADLRCLSDILLAIALKMAESR